jgi:hypothetical protein
MCWNFFSIGHGKGPHDGAWVVIKRLLCRKQLNVHGAKLQNAKEVVMFLQKHLSTKLKSTYCSSCKLSKESCCMSRLKMWIGCLLYLCVIMSKGP